MLADAVMNKPRRMLSEPADDGRPHLLQSFLTPFGVVSCRAMRWAGAIWDTAPDAEVVDQNWKLTEAAPRTKS